MLLKSGVAPTARTPRDSFKQLTVTADDQFQRLWPIVNFTPQSVHNITGK